MAVVKQALREERAFTRFCREVKTFKVLPDAPDFRFLMRLRGFIENRNTAAEVLEIKGLNPDAEKLRSEFTVFAFSHMHREKLASLLEKFVREPDKITRRYYEQVAELVPMRSLQENVSRMGESISTARSFNHKAAVARGWDGLDFQRLEMLDNRLPRISQSLPAALGEILLHPFVHNLAVLCRRLATDAGSDRAARLVRSIRFLLPRLAGEQLQELERRLLAHRGEWVEQAELDPKAWQRKIEGMGIEDKVILLNGLRLRIQDHPHRGPESHLPDLFGEDFDEFFDEDDDDFPEEAAADDVNLARVLLVLHHDILQDISRPQAKLSPRERKELVGVMEPVLLQDLDFILDQMEDTDEFMSFLNSAIGAGCAGIR
ncbi:MAG TPA: hypothetical protein DCE18_16155, partial [Syntrophobacteraceae bacterium]|nr:hypothetical protein [Syntrophobacteraceae bacterium]